MGSILIIAIICMAGAFIFFLVTSLGGQENKPPNGANKYLQELAGNDPDHTPDAISPLPQFSKVPDSSNLTGISLIILIVAVLVVIYSRNNSAKPFDIRVDQTTGEEFEIQKGDYSYVFAKVEDIDMDLRIFGYNPSHQMFGNQNIGKYDVVSHLFIAAPLEMNKAAFERNLCEIRSINKASMLQIVAETAEVDKKINGLANAPQGLCAHVTGSALRLEQYQHQDKDPQNAWEFNPGGQFNFNPRSFLLLSDITSVPCR